MEYTYDVFVETIDKTPSDRTRKMTTTNFLEVEAFIESGSWTNTRTIVVISDNLKDVRIGEIEGDSALFAWREKLERDHSWLGKTTKKIENLKNIAALNKLATDTVPSVATFALGMAMANGADKYGKYNWRKSEVTVSVFLNALTRHLEAYKSGENYADDSKIHHLAHIMAGCAILLDAEVHGVLIDDRDSFGIDLGKIEVILKNKQSDGKSEK